MLFLTHAKGALAFEVVGTDGGKALLHRRSVDQSGLATALHVEHIFLELVGILPVSFGLRQSPQRDDLIKLLPGKSQPALDLARQRRLVVFKHQVTRGVQQ
ncbi:MAG: hypothetical protein USCGTAYLOR_02361 [Chromatiales bacterium USCg_Taylor]|nr:MAG: hypothetical protein USCGTAYLOR_02361 [Chromatiales bacterium USCg_Taylor]